MYFLIMATGYDTWNLKSLALLLRFKCLVEVILVVGLLLAVRWSFQLFYVFSFELLKFWALKPSEYADFEQVIDRRQISHEIARTFQSNHKRCRQWVKIELRQMEPALDWRYSLIFGAVASNWIKTYHDYHHDQVWYGDGHKVDAQRALHLAKLSPIMLF